MKKWCYIWVTENYTVIKENSFLIHTVIRMNLKDITLKKGSQTYL